MNSQVCVTCRNKKPVNSTNNRLVTESCGHVKCMGCLLLEKAGCVACLAEKSEQTIADVSEKQTTNKIVLGDLRKKKKLETSHIKTETDANGKYYLCTVCKKKFHARSHVAYHSYCNGQSKPFACALCPQSFVSHSHFKYHMRVHRNERPYVCDVCGQNFIQTSKLKRHKLKHTKEKKHPCMQCNKAFNNKTSLRKHNLIHTEERPYSCPTCSRRFRDSSNLQKHIRNHNMSKRNECLCPQCGREGCGGRCGSWRRHQCARCPQAFHSSKDLRRHAAVHTDSKPFRCKVCERNFRRKDNLERHIRNTHPNYSTATAVETDETALQQISIAEAKQDDIAAKTQLEILNPLPPIPIDLILADTKVEIDKSYIIFANNARQSVIVGKPTVIEKRAESPCEYVHKIRRANSMAHQKKIQLPPIDETKMRELTSGTNSNNCVVTPPKDKMKFIKILYEDDEVRDADVIPQLHWRKMKLNQDGMKNQEIKG